MSRLMELESINLNLRHDQTAKGLGYSSSILQRYKHDIKMESPYKSKGPKKLKNLK